MENGEPSEKLKKVKDSGSEFSGLSVGFNPRAGQTREPGIMHKGQLERKLIFLAERQERGVSELKRAGKMPFPPSFCLSLL